MTIKIGINGFGRIGRMVFRAAVAELRATSRSSRINDLLEPDYLAYMLQYDSVHGRFKGDDRRSTATRSIVNGKRIRLTQEKDPAEPQVGRRRRRRSSIESTGLFLTWVIAKQPAAREAFYERTLAARAWLVIEQPSADGLDLAQPGYGTAWISMVAATAGDPVPTARVHSRLVAARTSASEQRHDHQSRHQRLRPHRPQHPARALRGRQEARPRRSSPSTTSASPRPTRT